MSLNITIHTQEQFNRNYNAVVKHTCQEHENEVQKQTFEEHRISQA